MDDNQTLYTDEKLLQSKKILISFKNHINKVVQAIDSKEINQSTLKTLMDTLDDYYKKYNIDIFSNDDSDEEDEEGDESEEESSNKDKSSTSEDNDSEDNDSEDSDSEDKLLKKNIESSTSTSSLNLNSEDDVKKTNEDILFEPFVNGSHIFKRNDYGYDINKNMKNFISNSYIY
jgi:hypothetical protein